MTNSVARVGVDTAGGLIISGASTVYVNNKLSAIEGSVIGSPPNPGDIIATSNTSVFVENKKIAIDGAVTARGFAVANSSPNVFAGRR